MIPDKIYLPKEEIEERKPWIETTYDPNWDECYIRKDALLEILKGYNHPVTRLIVQEIIDKINSI